MESMQELIERLDVVTAPDRQLDVLIALALDWSHPSAGCTLRQLQALGETVEDIAADTERQTSILNQLPRYTASLDDAMTLIPQGWESVSIRQTDDGEWHAELARHDGHMMAEDPEEWWVDAERRPNPALALCAASLRAMAYRPVPA